MPQDPEMQSRSESAPDPLLRALSEIRRLRDDPRTLVIVTHAFVELMVNKMVEAVCKHGRSISEDTRSFTHSTKLVHLSEVGVLSDHHYRLLNWFRKLRNDCAHNWEFTLEAGRLDVFADPSHQDVTKFADLCVMILLDLWTSHDTLIGVSVLPTFYETSDKKVLVVEGPAPKYAIPLRDDPKTVRERL